MKHECYLCGAPLERYRTDNPLMEIDSAPGSRCHKCTARWAPKPRITTKPLGNLNEMAATARVVRYDYHMTDGTPVDVDGPPFVKAWAAGGCMVCGGPERDRNEYAHTRCSDTPTLEAWQAWRTACDDSEVTA